MESHDFETAFFFDVEGWRRGHGIRVNEPETRSSLWGFVTLRLEAALVPHGRTEGR